MPNGHTRDTKIAKKGLTYHEIWQKSLKIVETVEKSPFVQKVVIFTECDLMKLWFEPISQVENKLNLKIKAGINKNIPFKEFLIQVTNKTFPLLTNNKGFKQTQLLELVKKQKINALLTISGYCEPNVLNNFKIFSIKENDTVKHTNEIKNQMVNVPFLALLLTEPKLKFQLTGIEKVYLYPTSDLNQFSQKSKNLLQIIKENQHQQHMVSFLKCVTNFFIGSLSFCPNSYKQHLVISKTDFFGLDWTRFQGSFSINEDITICTFNNNQYFCNNLHNHFNIISSARTIFLHFSIGIAKWTEGELRICNTGEDKS